MVDHEIPQSRLTIGHRANGVPSLAAGPRLQRDQNDPSRLILISALGFPAAFVVHRERRESNGPCFAPKEIDEDRIGTMITVRKSEERRHVQSRIQNTWSTFDPENDLDPLRRGFHGLECLREETLAPEMGLHPREQTEIDLLTYVREGALIYQDDAGRLARMEAGEFQHRSVSSRMPYQAVNGSFTDDAQVFQSCLTSAPHASGMIPEQRRFYTAERTGSLKLIASQGGKQASLSLNQDVRVYSSILHSGSHLVHEFEAGRTAWLHVVKGRILLQDLSLRTGDGVAMIDEGAASFTAQEPSEILLFDLA